MRISDWSSDVCSSDLLLTEIPQPQHAGAVALYRLWQDLTPAGGLPARDGFTFERLGALGILGNFFVVEPLDGGRDWRYRLLGTHITWLFGADVTNVPFTRHFDSIGRASVRERG